ncbi:hypothetical protein MASR2M66_26220 [Chloroflexota bacterium]
MNWKKIEKDPAKQPADGTYSDWKPLLAVEGFNQCVYCAINENSMGGIRNFHVEHYRPKSKFADKENDYCNLFYSCPICNTFKSNDWPNEPIADNSIASYPNPSDVDYNTLFDIDIDKGLIEGKNVAAKYIQQKIFLNRPQLITERRVYFLFRKGRVEIEETKNLLKLISDNEDYRAFSEIFMDLSTEFLSLLERLQEIPRYQMGDIKRP